MGIKGVLGVFNILCVVTVALFMLYASMLKLVAYPGMEDSFVYWGYPGWMMYAVGILELAIAVCIYIPKTRIIAAIVLVLEMFGALYTHFQHQEYEQLTSAITMIVLSSVIMIGAYLSRRMS